MTKDQIYVRLSTLNREYHRGRISKEEFDKEVAKMNALLEKA